MVTDNDNNLWTQQVFLYFTKTSRTFEFELQTRKKAVQFYDGYSLKGKK